jgi:hypothetical protein
MPDPNVNGFSRHDCEPFGSKRDFRHGSKSEVGGRNREVRFTPESRLNSDIAACLKRADIVAKVPKCGAANFSPKKETSDNRRSIWLQTRYENRQ